MDKKRRAGRPGEFLVSLSVGGPRRGDERYARTGGPAEWDPPLAQRRREEGGEGAKRDLAGPGVGDAVVWGAVVGTVGVL